MKFFQDGGGRHLGFVRTVNSAVVRRPRKTHPRTKHEVDRITRCRHMAIRVCWGHTEPPFWGKGGRRGSAMAPLERTMVVSYRLSIVTVALCVTIRPQFANECLRRSNQQGWVALGPNLGVFPLEQTRHVGVAKSEHPRLTNGEIIFEEFQPICDHNPPTLQTDRQTDDMRSQYRALH